MGISEKNIFQWGELRNAFTWHVSYVTKWWLHFKSYLLWFQSFIYPFVSCPTTDPLVLNIYTSFFKNPVCFLVIHLCWLKIVVVSCMYNTCKFIVNYVVIYNSFLRYAGNKLSNAFFKIIGWNLFKEKI